MRIRRTASHIVQAAATSGRRVGLLPYRPEQWTRDQWTSAYDTGTLEYYNRLDEMARYSVILGYVGWFGESLRRLPSILDVGCGVGLLRQRLCDDAFSQYVGVDLSAAAIANALSHAHVRSRFIVGDVASADLGRFDIVILNEVLYYASDPPGFLRELRRVRNTDGLLIVSMWRHPGDRTLWRTVDGANPIVDRVEVRNRANPTNPKGWLVAACR
jgi:SAM-dependent methyltransferase